MTYVQAPSFPGVVILVCVRWYCKYGISCRDLAEMMQERGVEVDPSTIMRWVHRYAPELEKRVRAYQRYGSNFLRKAVATIRNWPPTSITTDKLPSYPEAIASLKRHGQLSNDTTHRTSKYLNNIIEADHGVLKRVLRPTRGFQTTHTATATIKGFEVMR